MSTKIVDCLRGWCLPTFRSAGIFLYHGIRECMVVGAWTQVNWTILRSEDWTLLHFSLAHGDNSRGRRNITILA